MHVREAPRGGIRKSLIGTGLGRHHSHRLDELRLSGWGVVNKDGNSNLMNDTILVKIDFRLKDIGQVKSTIDGIKNNLMNGFHSSG